MIQRIQSVYLLIVAILSVIIISNPIGSLVGTDNSITEFTNLSLVYQDGAKNYEPWALFAIQLLSAMISFVTIFLYKRRMLQLRLSIFNIVLGIGYYGALVTFVLLLKGDASFVPSWIVCLPFAGIVLDWLAIRAIGKDEILVRAYDRLR